LPSFLPFVPFERHGQGSEQTRAPRWSPGLARFAAVAPMVAALTVGLASLAPAAFAQTLPPPQNVLTLTASASADVTMDLLSVTFGTTREAADPGAVQAQLRQALDAALAEARKIARPGQVEVQTGAFSLYPRYGPKNAIAGWQGRAEMVVEGLDSAAIAQLAGRIQTLSIARVAHRLSREAREKAEAEVSTRAIGRFRERAQIHAQQFGFGGFQIREVQIDTGGEHVPVPLPRARMAAAPAGAADESLPVEAGKATVTATVSGSVQMTK
jgi:predicted secreted protein